MGRGSSVVGAAPQSMDKFVYPALSMYLLEETLEAVVPFYPFDECRPNKFHSKILGDICLISCNSGHFAGLTTCMWCEHCVS